MSGCENKTLKKKNRALFKKRANVGRIKKMALKMADRGRNNFYKDFFIQSAFFIT
jgi:hypothetical protein